MTAAHEVAEALATHMPEVLRWARESAGIESEALEVVRDRQSGLPCTDDHNCGIGSVGRHATTLPAAASRVDNRPGLRGGTC